MRCVASFFGFHAVLHVFVYFHSDVRADFIIQLLDDFFPAKDAADSCERAREAQAGPLCKINDISHFPRYSLSPVKFRGNTRRQLLRVAQKRNHLPDFVVAQ